MFAVCCLLFSTFIPAARSPIAGSGVLPEVLCMFRVKQGAKQHIERVEKALVGRLNQIVRHAQQLQLAGVVTFPAWTEPAFRGWNGAGS